MTTPATPELMMAWTDSCHSNVKFNTDETDRDVVATDFTRFGRHGRAFLLSAPPVDAPHHLPPYRLPSPTYNVESNFLQTVVDS